MYLEVKCVKSSSIGTVFYACQFCVYLRLTALNFWLTACAFVFFNYYNFMFKTTILLMLVLHICKKNDGIYSFATFTWSMIM